MRTTWRIPRRAFLRGAGAALSLPLLEAMVPEGRAQGASEKSPRRMAVVYVPNGANMPDWTPAEIGVRYEVPYILKPLEPFRREFQIVSGLAHDKARANGDGSGDHARANATFLTARQARKTPGVDIEVGVSIDQEIASRIGNQTRLPSLEISTEQFRLSGVCDSGYSCAYQSSISWKTPSMPLPPEADPRLVFERLFGTPETAGKQAATQRQFRKSILDFAMEDARRLKRKVGKTDQRKLDQYMDSVRDVELRIENAHKFDVPKPDMAKPEGVPDRFQDHVRILYDLMALAFQTDSTRVATFLVAHDGDNRSYPEIGVREGHHDLSHHGNDPSNIAKIRVINRYHTHLFAYFLNKLKSIPEGEGNLLDQSMILYGSGISDGNIHNNENLPVILAGHGGGTLRAGRHLKLGGETPMANLLLSMSDRMGVELERLGDSTGRLNLV